MKWNNLKFSLGTVLTLPVVEIVKDSEFVLFDIGGYEARLYLSEISNNHTLSSKLFPLIRKGDIIDVVIIEFNDIAKYVNLSLKPFRNALMGNISYTRSKKIVEEEAKERLNVRKKSLIQDRNTLNRAIGDLQKTDLTFLYELIQNAVDHPNTQFNNNVNVKFQIFNDYLLLMHDGAIINEANFQAITGIFNSDEDKEQDNSKIGYKGIGFKSVFRYSQNVYIRSGNFSFKFDKEETGKDLPWEVIPIFQNEIQKIEEIPHFEFFNSPVAFAFKLTDHQIKEKVISYLNKLLENPYLLIFLKNLTKLQIILPEQTYSITKHSESKGGYEEIEIIINDKSESKWLSFSQHHILEDQEIINELTNENNSAIPAKFRTFRRPNVSIILPIDSSNDNLINLFTYLPLSNTKIGLPYIINADFIPNLDRTDIIENLEYNYKIAGFAGENLLLFAKLLAEGGDFKNFIRLIPNFELSGNKFLDILHKTFVENLNKHLIFPTHKEDNFVLLDELLLDKTALSNCIGSTEFEEITKINEYPLSQSITDSLPVEKLIIHSQKGLIFSKEVLQEKILQEEFQNWLKVPENNFKFIQHLAEAEDLKLLLDSEAIILSEKKVLALAKNLYGFIPSVFSHLSLETLNSGVKLLLDEVEIDLKLKKFEAIPFFKKYSDKILLLSNQKDLFDTWNWIYDHWEDLKTEKDITGILGKLRIPCKPKGDSLVPEMELVSETYLSVEFSSDDNNIEGIISDLQLSNIQFISPELVTDARISEKWRPIFKKAKAIVDLQDVIGELIDNLKSIDKSQHFKIAQEIFKFWKKAKKHPEHHLSADQTKKIQENLKLLCVDGSYKISSEIILSDHYNNNSLQEDLLPIIRLSHNISSNYEPNQSNVVDWKTFLSEILSCRELTQQQDIFEAKIAQFCFDQINATNEQHFEILNKLSLLYTQNPAAIDFNPNLFKTLKLKTNNNTWVTSNKIHLSSRFVKFNDLDLQQDSTVNNVDFLSEEYNSEFIKRDFLVKILKVRHTFKISLSEDINITEVPNSDFKIEMESAQKWKNRKQELLALPYRKYTMADVNRYTSLINFINVTYLELSLKKKYNSIFWKLITKTDKLLNLLTRPCDLKNNGRCYNTLENNLLYFIKRNNIVENQMGELKKPTELYSWDLSKYLPKNLVPKENFTTYQIGDKSLEEVIGIRQKVSPTWALNLISKEDVSLSKEEVSKLCLLDILAISSLHDNSVFQLPNSNYEWKPIHELFTTSDAHFIDKIEPKQLLHADFKKLAAHFSIKELSEETLSLKMEPVAPNLSNEISQFFSDKAEYIAFKITDGNAKKIDEHLLLAENLQESINKISFYEGSQLQKIFPSENPIYTRDIEFYEETKDSIFYKNNWKTNDEVIDYLIRLIGQEKISKEWFEDVVNRWSPEILLQKLQEEFETTPWDEPNPEIEPTEVEPQTQERDFQQEVKDFIENDLREVEDIYDEAKVEDLKSILQSFKNHPEGKRKSFNLLAKLKLCKTLRISYSSDWEFNRVDDEKQKYFIHSARGAFAYIHPNELIVMRDEGYKMAIDYGSRDVRIYDTAEEILALYNNYLMLYQKPESIEDVLQICEQSQGREKFHFLIVDKEKQIEGMDAIFKLMNIETYD